MTRRIKKRIHEHDYRVIPWNENPFALRPQYTPEDAIIVEQFSAHFMPQFNPEELKPLGMDLAELNEHYSANLVIPRWQGMEEEKKRQQEDEQEDDKPDSFLLLVVRNDDQDEWKNIAKQIARNPRRRDFLFPEVCLVELKIDNGYFNLEVQTLVEVIPDLDPPDVSNIPGLEDEVISDRTVLSMHKPFGLVPVIIRVLGPGLVYRLRSE